VSGDPAARDGSNRPPGLVLTGGTVVTSLDPPRLAKADVVIAGDRVAAIGTAPAGAPRRDCSGTLILPGNVCAHHHLYSALARGMPYRLPPPGNFLEILQRVWWRLDRALDEPAVRASALAGGLDALRAGTTTVIDHHASPNFVSGSLDVIAAALSELGLRSVLCYEVSDRDGAAVAAAGVAENRRFLARSGPLSRGLMGAHASFTLSPDTLAACAEAARAAGAGLHIHVAEDAVDERDAQARHGMTVTARLAKAGVLGPGTLLAHCVHVSEAEVAEIVASGATVVVNPRSNMNNRVGWPPLAAGGQPRAGGAAGGAAAGGQPRAGEQPGIPRVALGTDGVGGDMFTESQAGYFRAVEASPGAPPDWPLRRLAEGARAAGHSFGEPLLGRLEPGAPADLIVLSYLPPTPLTWENLAGHWVFGLSCHQVRDVIVAGELVIADGRSTRVDEAEVAARAARTARSLWERLERIPPHPFVPGRMGLCGRLT
jgi:cytosine/adenosine deaminase-related metal-dependent hydrolase